MKKRLIATLLALCLALALLPGTAWAAEDSGSCGDNVTYSYSDGTLIIQGMGRMADYSSYKSVPWYDYCEEIYTVNIGDGVTSIGSYAFIRCSHLTSVTIPNSVASIESRAFDGCRNLTSVTIPNSVISIGEYAFSNCKSFISVTIPNSVTSIGDAAFWECYSLTSVTIPNSVTSIGAAAFQECYMLTSVTIPASVTSIERLAFAVCNSLTSISVASGNPAYISVDGVLFSDDQTLLHTYPAGKTDISYRIPNSVTTIEDFAFYKCNNLTSVTIPNSVISIGDRAFDDCNSLTDVYYIGSETQWKQIAIDSNINATIHYNSTSSDSGDSSMNDAKDINTSGTAEYIYDSLDTAADVTLDTNRLNTVTDTATATEAVRAQVQSMTTEQKSTPTGIDLATLYAETAVAKAASKEVTGQEIIINKAAVSDLEAVAAQTNSAVDTALINGGVTTARIISNIVTLTTDKTGEISIKIDPDILTTNVDKIRVETPTYALTLNVPELEPDLTGIITITAQDVGSGYAPGNQNKKTTVQVNLPKGKTTNPVTVSLPKDSGETTYQAVVKTDGTPTSSKYNPATTTMDGKITTSGTYTVQTNQKDFTDIANKSAEMQSAIRYLASKGIINGDTDTTFSPDASISRAEIAALIVRALGKLDSSATNSFTDVTTANWYYSAAGSSQRLGIITGYEDNTFRGTTAINKEQIVAVAARVLISEMNYKTPGDTATYLGKYSDTVVAWAQPQVALATKENLVVYRTDGTFSGAKNMTRGDAAIIIYRLFQKIW